MAPSNGAIHKKQQTASFKPARSQAAPENVRLQAEARQVAVAVGNLCARHQQPVDGGQQSAEQRAGGHKCNRSGLGHRISLSWRTAKSLSRRRREIYVCQIPKAISVVAWQHLRYCIAA